MAAAESLPVHNYSAYCIFSSFGIIGFKSFENRVGNKVGSVAHLMTGHEQTQ